MYALLRSSLLLSLFAIHSYLASDELQSKAGHAQAKKPYVIGAVLGGLGNLMFEVAATCALAWDNDAEPYFPDFAPGSKYVDGYYRHVFFRCNIYPPSKEISQEWCAPCYGYYPIPFQPKLKISGCFQNEKYFAHHRDRLLKLFAPHPKDLLYLQRNYSWIINNPNTVSVHLRYYYSEKPDEDSFIQYDREYFEKAMALFPESSLFVVVSDNLDFACQNIPSEGRNVVFIQGESIYIDFYLQSMCKHNIISNSTFSWWSAWLNQNPSKIVVRPALWMSGYPDIGGPDEWIKIDAQGMQARLKATNK
jgi:hypothetical protein